MLPAKHSISFIAGPYESERFFKMAKGLEHVKEGGERCFKCYELRLGALSACLILSGNSFLQKPPQKRVFSCIACGSGTGFGVSCRNTLILIILVIMR